MAYTTGTANSLAALRSAIVAACVAAGWVSTGQTLTKGTMAIQIDEITTTGAQGAAGLRFRGGTGQAAGVVTGGAPWASDIGTSQTFLLIYPVTYHVFALSAPDEVYVFLNYNLDWWQWAAWGQSSIALPGTGMWFGASIYSRNAAAANATNVLFQTGGFGGADSNYLPWLFGRSVTQASQSIEGRCEAHIHHGLDGATWSAGTSAAPGVSACDATAQMLGMLPSAWNSETVLVPIHVALRRPSNRRTLVASLAHARFVRLDNHAPGEIIALGTDQWMLLPWLRKNASARTGMTNATSLAADVHSGTFGVAVRYDGT